MATSRKISHVRDIKTGDRIRYRDYWGRDFGPVTVIRVADEPMETVNGTLRLDVRLQNGKRNWVYDQDIYQAERPITQPIYHLWRQLHDALTRLCENDD